MEFLAVMGERGAENDGTSYIEAIGLAVKALAALDGIGEPFAWCLTDVNRKPAEFTDHPKHKHETKLAATRRLTL